MMNMRTITAVFDSRAEAERAETRLRELGVPASDLRVMGPKTGAPEAGIEQSAGDGGQKGLWESIRDFFVPDEDRYGYEESLRRGGYLLTARVAEDRAEQAIGILEASNPVDLDRREEEWRAQGWSGPQAAPEEGTSDAYASENRTGVARGAEPSSEERIPVVEERMRVGKRVVDRGGVRVRSYVVEEPVHEQVALRDERVDIERRPVNQPVTSAADADALLKERDIEVSETGEEAVIGKEAVVKEELAVRKSADERIEEIDDTVRHTEVQVDDARRRGRKDRTDRPRP